MRKYKEALEKMGISAYKAAVSLGCTRQYLGRVLTGKVGAGSRFEERWISAFGELPEDDGIVRDRSASPKIIKERVPAVIDSDACILALGTSIEQRIKKAFGDKMPKDNEDFINLMVGSWKTGVLDAGKFFSSANAER